MQEFLTALGPSKQQYNNLDIHRVLRYFPTWSQAYKHYYSNTGKLLGPLMQAVSTKANLVDAIIEGTYSGKIPFGYSRYSYTQTRSLIPNTIMTMNGSYQYVGDIGDCNPAMFAYKSCMLTPYSYFDKWQFAGTNMTTPQRFGIPQRVYVRQYQAQQNKLHQVHIIGADRYGKIIREQIDINSLSARESINLYQYVTRVYSEDEFMASTYLDLNSHSGAHAISSIAGFNKRIADMHGNFFDPEFYLSDNIVYIHNGTSGTREDNWQMNLDIPSEEKVTDFFITTYFDIICITNAGNLYSGKLMLDNMGELLSFEQQNNNDAIQLDYDNGTEISAQINVDFLKTMYSAKMVRLELKAGNDFWYIDGDGQFTKNSNEWISLENISGKTRVFFDREDSRQYELSIRIDQTPEVFSVKTISNTIRMYKLAEFCTKMIYVNRELVVEKDGQFYVVDGLRMVFLSTKDGILFSEEVDLRDS